MPVPALFDSVVGAASDAVTALAAVLAPVAGGSAAALAIVLFTIAVRLLISPLTVAQIRGERRRAVLAPQIRQLQQRYADDPARLRVELSALYRRAGANPLAGCLPALLQAPFFLVMYQLFSTADPGRGLLAQRLAGVPLGQHVTDGLAGAAGPLFGVLLLVLLLLAWSTSRRMRRAAAVGADAAAGAGPTAAGSGSPAAGAGAATAGTDVAAGLARVLPLLPYGTVLVALVVPLAGVLYLVTTTAWTAGEQALLRRQKTSTSVDIRPGGTYNS
ncbi:YidC/Oxa1 family membrane protein insertase [Micromonospora echinofusca]|uniref:Membrane protein insertase YidC n=1 Tax=Micromonospora echinofusca TaxID=47858 RepID=A0ABS3VY96_MICEH|nr:YidC/Oxa1 family membrane protein insertase [Micromonospora echinofusca]MBO4209517.1 membrane protein insertase YidC [Micromonospora echinofusca]